MELWCYAIEWASRVRSLTAHDSLVLKNRTPEERVSGRTPDISEFAHYGWFDWVWFREETSFPEENLCLGKWLGVASKVGQAMTYWIMTSKGSVIACSSVTHLTAAEQRDSSIQADKDRFLARICELKRYDLSISGPIFNPSEITDDDTSLQEMFTSMEADDYTPEAYDEYLSAQVVLPRGDNMVRGEVVRRRRDSNGRPIGKRNLNPILDTREYEVLFPDGSTQAYMANSIAESLYSQVDEEGRSFRLIEEIVDHEKDASAISKEDMSSLNRHTTKGWSFLVSWKDGTPTYVPLHEIKNAYPVETADYVIANGLIEEPAFRWWVPYVRRKREAIIGKLKKGKTKYWSRTYKYGIELPKTVQQALEIDSHTGTTFWHDAIDKEMKNVLPAFKFTDDDQIPVGFKHITCHMIFDVKMVGLVRKARFVAGGHLTDPPVESVYSSVVTRESVRIMFLTAALNDLDLLGADVQNAYINTKTEEKVYTTAGPEFGSNQGRPAIIVRALYGLKSSGARWRDHFASILKELGFTNSRADPDVWMHKAVKPDGFRYWEYVLCYVDDILIISHAPQGIMDDIAKYVKFKPGSVQPPEHYLGADTFCHTICEGKQVWAMSSQEYIRHAIQEVERELAIDNSYLPKKVQTPLSHNYRPELDFSNELDSQ